MAWVRNASLVHVSLFNRLQIKHKGMFLIQKLLFRNVILKFLQFGKMHRNSNKEVYF